VNPNGDFPRVAVPPQRCRGPEGAKDGGTCINEAAVVAACFDYRPIRHIAEDATLLFAAHLSLRDVFEQLQQ
jgi:hypothetical protein